MNVMHHHPMISSKMPVIQRRLPVRGSQPVSMIKIERGLVQRSLLYCFEKGYFSLIRYLLQSGKGDARERDNENRTGLMYCCFIDNDNWAQSIAMTLLEYGAKIEDQDQRGLNALHYAIITQRLILIRRYLSSLDFNFNRTIDIHGNTILHYACSTDNIDIVRLILNSMNRYSIDLNIKNHSGLTAYDIACQLKNKHCQNLLQNELLIRQNKHLPSIKSNNSHITFESINDRRSSISTRTRPITSSTTYQSKSIASLPLFIPNSKISRQRNESNSSLTNENFVHSLPKFIDPIEARHMILKHNENLDLSLANQAKTRPDFASIPFISESTIFNSSSSTWRDDFSKMIDQLQTFKTSSYKKTVHPPLNNELSCELFDRLYGLGESGVHDCSNHQSLSSLPLNSSQKIIHRRRSSTSSIKSLHKMKK